VSGAFLMPGALKKFEGRGADGITPFLFFGD
jgi:hypothetical protein